MEQHLVSCNVSSSFVLSQGKQGSTLLQTARLVVTISFCAVSLKFCWSLKWDVQEAVSLWVQYCKREAWAKLRQPNFTSCVLTVRIFCQSVFCSIDSPSYDYLLVFHTKGHYNFRGTVWYCCSFGEKTFLRKESCWWNLLWLKCPQKYQRVLK